MYFLAAAFSATDSVHFTGGRKIPELLPLVYRQVKLNHKRLEATG